MERLHSLIVSVAGFDGEEPHGHVVVITRESGVTEEALEIALELPQQPLITDSRAWARRVLSAALAEL